MTTPDRHQLLRELDDLYADLLRETGHDKDLAESLFRARVAEAPHYIDALLQDDSRADEDTARYVMLAREPERLLESRIPVRIDEDTWVAVGDLTVALCQRWAGYTARRRLATDLRYEASVARWNAEIETHKVADAIESARQIRDQEIARADNEFLDASVRLTQAFLIARDAEPETDEEA
jgi:hypothetical protein